MSLRAKVAVICILFAGIMIPFVARYYDAVVFRYATHFEVPEYSRDRESIDDLTGGRFADISDLRTSLGASLAKIDFKPYLSRAIPAPEADVDRILTEGYQLRGNPVWKAGQPFDWNYDPHHDRNWRFRMNALDPLESFAAAYVKSKDNKLFAIVKESLFDWIDYNLVKDGENEFKWYDMATGIRATRLAFLYYYGITRKYLSDDELATLLAAMDMHVEALANPRLLNRGNHGLFQMLGLASICHVAPVLDSCETGMPYARETFRQIARGQFSDEGMHMEHSSQYHPWAIKTIEDMLRYGYFDGLDGEFLVRAKANIIHYFYPDGSMILLGDTGEQHVCSIREMHEFVEFLCSGGRSGKQPDAKSLAFMNSGYAIVRSDWDARPLSDQSYLFFNGAYHSQAHKQADDFSLLWYERGRPILVDSGKYSYDKSEWRRYAVSTRAHNTVEIDGIDYTTSRRDAYGSALKTFEQFGDTYFLMAEALRKKIGVNHRRLVAIRPGKFLFIIDVMADKGRTHKYRQWFHFHENLKVEQQESGMLEVSSNTGERLVFGIMYANSEHSGQLVKGQKVTEIQGWISRRYKQIKPNYALSNESAGGTVVLAAGFSVVTRGHNDQLMIDSVATDSLRFCFGEVEGIQIDMSEASLKHVPCVIH